MKIWFIPRKFKLFTWTSACHPASVSEMGDGNSQKPRGPLTRGIGLYVLIANSRARGYW